MAGRDIVVVGGSAGNIEVLAELVAGLSPDFPGTLFVVAHFPGSVTSTRHPHDRESIEPGRIYGAPPDCHLHVSDGRAARLTTPRRGSGRWPKRSE